jgi:formate dehydrogenase accessory protein FdhD
VPDLLPIGIARHAARRIREDGVEALEVSVAEEVPVALVYNGISHAVMMASPTDLEAFALGFSLSEGILAEPAELLDLAVTRGERGVEIALRITARRAAGLQDRRRSLAGRTGCGLCGVESLAEALRDLPRITSDIRVGRKAIDRALDALYPLQVLNRAAGAVHAAAWADPDGAILAVAEDVGRHNALDKLIGKLAVGIERSPPHPDPLPPNGAERVGVRWVSPPEGLAKHPPGFLVLTSRCSYEMVAKAAMRNIPLLVAISAPTGLALDVAERVGLTVVALARKDAITVYTHPARIAELTEAET